MRSLEFEDTGVVSNVHLDGTPLMLVEDSFAADSEDAAPESQRVWSSETGVEVKTITSRTSSGSEELGQRVIEALAGVALERAMTAGREAMALEVGRAKAAELSRDDDGLLVNGRPSRTMVASSGEATVIGAIVADITVLVVTQGGRVSLTLGNP